jgi:murein DD-endopeptidase MepM/ murein hydrolase activator NlpD
LASKKRFYILFVSRDEDGNLNKVPVPLHYAYVFVAAAVIGMFTITGMAGSYSRMLIKTAKFNQLRTDHNSLQKDYAHLEQQAHEKDIQAASLGSLATEVSALYGLTTSKLAAVSVRGKKSKAPAVDVAKSAGTAPLADVSENVANVSDDSYTKSLDAFYALRSNAMNGDTTRFLATPVDVPSIAGRMGQFHGLDGFGGGGLDMADAPSLWPITGPITSSFGEREDPVLGNGEGEFHPGIDISAPIGTPIHATADGVVTSADLVNGYGRMVAIDHGHGLMTMYGHMSGFAVTAGQQVSKGQVIGYVGHSGRTTGNHVHYEVRIRNTPVNPHKYLRMTLAQLGTTAGE